MLENLLVTVSAQRLFMAGKLANSALKALFKDALFRPGYGANSAPRLLDRLQSRLRLRQMFVIDLDQCFDFLA